MPLKLYIKISSWLYGRYALFVYAYTFLTMMTSAALGFFENLISGSSPAQTVTTLLSDPPQSVSSSAALARGITKGLSINVQNLISKENIRFRI